MAPGGRSLRGDHRGSLQLEHARTQTPLPPSRRQQPRDLFHLRRPLASRRRLWRAPSFSPGSAGGLGGPRGAWTWASCLSSWPRPLGAHLADFQKRVRVSCLAALPGSFPARTFEARSPRAPEQKAPGLPPLPRLRLPRSGRWGGSLNRSRAALLPESRSAEAGRVPIRGRERAGRAGRRCYISAGASAPPPPPHPADPPLSPLGSGARRAGRRGQDSCVPAPLLSGCIGSLSQGHRPHFHG